jgi:hypothetical protein
MQEQLRNIAKSAFFYLVLLIFLAYFLNFVRGREYLSTIFAGARCVQWGSVKFSASKK